MDPAAKPTQIMGKSTFLSKNIAVLNVLHISIKPNLAFQQKICVCTYNAEDIELGGDHMQHTHSFCQSLNWVLNECISIKY